ncbi:hypothetical protein PV08_02472 [Exophiala spinifera]|uniref:ER lumen protein-retaining receptor n=1 Tax=Exophiala spinifera TaxID=91928 RepID=A0A0D2C3H7_9EURO|nr:uncharacterized protein PV08_02472 [Exophiala spinifera]KIW18184.1 hypothetical protein PV08_02472 [Exophiala spinifera]
MTDYAPRSSQDYNTFFHNQQLAMSHYSNSNGLNYLYSNGQVQYQTVNPQYPAYSTAFTPAHNGHSSSMYIPNVTILPLQYPITSTRVPTLPSQSRALASSSFYTASPSNHRTSLHQRIMSPRDYGHVDGTECQDSPNEDTMLSEPVIPPLEGYPNVNDFDELVKRYVQDLSPKKQDKALINARRATNIRHVLIDKKTTSIESAQFRFWVKKMFTLQSADGKPPEHRKICHEGKPVAVREKLFKILTKAHKQCQHGGRDKTSAQVRRVYSWVPKELISRFVKLCPTCQVRRGTARNSPPELERSPETRVNSHSPEDGGVSESRKSSTSTRSTAVNNVTLPLLSAGFPSSAAFQQQNRWMTPLSPQQDTLEINPVGSNNIKHEVYNTIPPMPITCADNAPAGMSFSSVNTSFSGPAAPSDIFWTFTDSAWNTIFKIIFLSSSAYTLWVMLNDYKPTHDPNLDTFRVSYLTGGSAILAILFPYKWTISEMLWAFSLWLESVAILPQLFMLQRTGEAETITTHYLFALGIYRALYIPNWIYRYFAEGHFDPIPVIAGIIQTVLYSDFFWVYYTKSVLIVFPFLSSPLYMPT